MLATEVTSEQITAGQLDLAIEVHNGLVQLVAPASPGSIDASSFDPRRNLALFLIAICAVAAFAIFIASVIWSQHLGSDVSDLTRIIGGAGLGSSFFALYTASEYIQSGTYDPKYNNTYLIRLGLGILSVLILAYFLKDFLNISSNHNGSPDSADLFKRISVAALALVGGFASDAVAQILKRVSETLVTLISGSDKDKIDAATQRAEINADKKTAQVVNDTATKLHEAISDPDPSNAVKNAQKVLKDLLTQK